MILRCKNYKDKLIKKSTIQNFVKDISDNPSLNDKQMDIPSNEENVNHLLENVNHLLEKFSIYLSHVFELSKTIAMTVSIEESRGRKSIKFTYIFKRERDFHI